MQITKSTGGRIMFQHLSKILQHFRYNFKRETTWHWFIAIIMGFIIRTNNGGITRMISSLKMKPGLYHNMLHFFRSEGYTVSDLYDKWIKIVERETELLQKAGRVILLGDHIKIPKEGRRMPDIQIMHQDSENSGKSEYIEGHIYAHVSGLLSNGSVTRSLPLITEQQKAPPKKEGSSEPDGDTLVTQMVNLVSKTVDSLKVNNKAIVALDAYFSKASAFLAADKAVDKSGNRRLEIVTRGRDDSVGYGAPEPRPKGKRGAAPKYRKIVLWDLFSDMSRFSEADLCLYGKPTKVKYLCMDLLWKPLNRVIRFVVVESYRGRMVLLCSDLTLSPENIIEIFSLRFKIETSFDEQKNDMGCFSYRFWTAALPKRKHWSKNDTPSITVHSELINETKRAINSFVCMGTIAAGILSIIAFSHSRQIWQRYPGWVRTLRSHVPTIAITKETIAQDFFVFLRLYSHLPLASFINSKMRSDEFLYDDVG